MKLAACLVLAAVAQAAPVIRQTGPVRSEVLQLKSLRSSTHYSLLYSLQGTPESVEITLSVAGQALLHKTLNAADADLYAPFQTALQPAELRIISKSTKATYRLTVNELPASPSLRAGPTPTWESATPIELGRTVFASADDTDYLRPSQTDWYRFEFNQTNPKLVTFGLDLMERDNLPVDVAVYRIQNGQPVEFTTGADPVMPPHETQALPGNKFTTRILSEQGAYYLRVKANHPEYKLRTRLYNPPPYLDPHQAVQTAVDYILGAGDSWHANTPRKGGTYDRVSSVHQETSLCVACHATHFPQRAQLIAAQNGYPVVQRQQLQFLTERFYNNPRPFYGFEQQGATWARVISAPANVLSRMSYLMGIFETQISGETRPEFHRGIREYLKLYYQDRDALPPDETNGNTPIVSAFEIAWHSWIVTKDPKLPALIAAADVRNVIDLCYQTQALAQIDPIRYAPQIRANADRLLALQRPDGQWSMRFDANESTAEFQTGHSLWALQAAGIPRDHPQVAKSIAYLLARQQPFGGWMDPLQSFENFRTPFRETQMAILALASYYPLPTSKKGWGTDPTNSVGSFPENPTDLLNTFDQIWDKTQNAKGSSFFQIAQSADDALVRQAAVESLGRLADPASIPTLTARLGDDSKLVQRTAAWALRQIYSRHPDTSTQPLIAAIASPDDRTRWGATRVFATHFSALARHPEVADALAARLADPNPAVRMQAVKGIWQLWFWTPDEPTRVRIEDKLLAALTQPQHPWVEQNLYAAIYNLADENIRYLYNNWIPRLTRPEDRDRAIAGRLKVEDRLAAKFADLLETGQDPQRKRLLAALTEFPLRRGDVYNPEADLSKPAPAVYSRIGNDIEQIVFFGQSAERMAKALRPLVDSPDPEMRRLATNASLMVREMKFNEVNRLAGPRGDAYTSLAAKVDALHPPKPPAEQTAANPTAPAKKRTVKLNEAYFRARVQPILEKKGKDGAACVMCHTNHTLFNATWSTVMNVINPDDPEKSLLLLKPTSTSEREGVLGALAHGGGQRWTRNSTEYLTILEWIRGASE